MSAQQPAIRFAMVGGGPGSFIGPVHRMAAELDRKMVLVAGAFSRDPEQCRATAGLYGLPEDRAYADWRQMLEAEKARPDGATLIAIVTPNHLHFPVAKLALEMGFDVVSDKPATATLEEAQELAGIVRDATGTYGLTYTYSGYAMLREAREMVRRGDLGKTRKVVVEYFQGWLSQPIEQGNDKHWRADASKAGLGGCIGDIGVHAFHAAEFVTGLKVTELCAQLSSIVDGRALDDDCTVLLRFDNGAPGVLAASQVATGERNGMRLRVYGETGGLDWRHDLPDQLRVVSHEGPERLYFAGSPNLGPMATAVARIPSGHPEGFIEAFANIYRDVASGIHDGAPHPLTPTIEDGLRGLMFVESAIRSSAGEGWTALATANGEAA